MALWAVFSVFAIPLAVIDARTRLLPTRLVYLALAAVACWLLLETRAWMFLPADDADELMAIGGQALLGAALATGLMLAVWLAGYLRARPNPAPMGFGDVRLAPLIGAPTGALGLLFPLVAIGAGALLAAAYGLARRKVDGFAFGPFLIAGAYLALGVYLWL
ncbi:MAG: prepilin peptidase [Propionibacteriaceae bacterium]|nr:prepilin peptidase [Propionibacteriaceae bacterium]